MIYKYALCEVATLDSSAFSQGSSGLIKTASGSVLVEPGSDKARIIEAEISKHPTALFFRAKAIKADEPNSNGDYFSEQELVKHYKTFEGVPFFTNHDNQNIENARGKVIYAEWVPAEKSVYIIAFIDREAFPHICRSIEEEYVTGVSMGCSVEFSECSICGNRAEKVDDFCSHIKNRKGRKFSGKVTNVRTGVVSELKDTLVYEKNYGIKFIELSAVVDPACASCRIDGIITNDEYLKRVANIQNSMYMIKTAAIYKDASQQEIEQLNQVLTTLESIAVNLIQNRQQVEVEFASDLVAILSDLQVFVDELIGAGYGKLQNVPGVGNAPMGGGDMGMGGAEDVLGAGGAPGVAPVAEETPLAGIGAPAPAAPAGGVGSVSGSPGKPMLQAPTAPKLPIMAPIRPKALDDNKMQKVAEIVAGLKEKLNLMGEDNMAKRRTISEKIEQKKIASEVLSNSWQEKQTFFEYISKVPSIQDNYNRLSVKKSDDSFIIVAENKDDESLNKIWTYEDLTNDEKEIIRKSPKEASMHFLGVFADSFVNQIKEGERRMTNTIKEAGASSVNKNPEVVTESQLDAKGLYHPRTGVEANDTIEKQLESKRSGSEKDVITEKQLAEKSNKLNPRTEDVPEVVGEKQLESVREDDEKNEVTQAQLEGNRTNTEPDVITEKQLNSVDTPWARAAKRDPKLFKSAGDHLNAVVDVMADTVIATGCTPAEIRSIASSLISSTKDRYELAGQMMDKVQGDSIDFSKRLAYWGQKNMKVAGIGYKEITSVFVKGLKSVASDTTINPDVMIDAIDVVCEDEVGIQTVCKKIDEKLANVKDEVVKVSQKEELRKALKTASGKDKRDEERKEILASVVKEEVKGDREAERKEWESKIASKKADTVIETTFQEMGLDKAAKRDASFKSAIRQFAKGALASQGIKMAAVVNVTVDNETVQIAVKTDDGGESVEIPIGDKTEPPKDEMMPEGDLAGEGLENQLSSMPPPSSGMPAGAPPAMASSNKMQKKAQFGGVGGGVPGTPADKAGGPGAAEAAIPATIPEEQPVESLTTDAPEAGAEEVSEEIPTAGEQQMPYAICPECGSSDVDVDNVDGNIKGSCKACGSEYEALVKKEIEFKILKPTKSIGKEGVEAIEEPEVPALPVAAQTKLDKGGMMRVASNQKKHGHVCPACGMNQCKASVDAGGHSKYTCPACKTEVEKDVIVNVNNPEETYLRVKWDIIPKVGGCESCKDSARKFASMLKVEKLMKSAMGTTEFPMANCVELVARKWGGNTVSTFGPCKGKPLANCVCNQLKTFAMTKVRHMEKLASVYTQKDPMDECVEDHMKKDFSKKESENLCGCLKKKFAKETDDNAFLQAFKEDVESGKEKGFSVDDLRVMNEIVTAQMEPMDNVMEENEDMDMGDVDLTPSEVTIDIDDVKEEKVSIELPKEVAEEVAAAAQEAVAKTEEVAPEAAVDVPTDTEAVDIEIEPVEGDMAMAMQTHKLRRVGDVVVKLAAKPTQIETVEKDVEAGVPRGKATMGNEGPNNIDKPLAKPSVPRGKATMGKEGPDNIDVKMDLPDVAVDSSYMGKEQENQKGMPAINNEIKGTVIAKKLKEVETVEKDVEAGVPRGKATIGNEGADNIDVKMDKPSVPRAKATMGEEGPKNIDVKMDAPDVPVGDGAMGKEKEVQKDMPGTNDEMLKNVAKKRDVQLERIANARRMKAVEIASKLLATARIEEGAYENVVDALSAFEIDKISSVAENMYPKRVKTASADSSVYSGPAIVIEAKAIEKEGGNLVDRLASQFTIGSKKFDDGLKEIGQK